MSRGTATTPIQLGPTRTRDTYVFTGVNGRADPGSDTNESTSATLIGTRANRLRAYMLPFAIAAALAAPVPPRDLRRQYIVSAATEMLELDWDRVEDLWEPIQELITNEQVQALNALLAIPYTNDPGFEYLADE
jgi:hypothetical protein